MKSAFDRLNLRPFERRLVVIVGTVVFLVLNVVFVWPHFHARAKALDDLEAARKLLAKFEEEVRRMPEVERKVKAMEKEGEPVPQQDQQLHFLTTVQMQAAQSGVTLTGNSKPETRTNQFFLEQSQVFSFVSAEQQLVDFLYTLGTGPSMIRVRGLTLRPDQPRQKLNGSVQLVASYQRAAPPKAAPAPVAAKKPAEKTAEKTVVKAADKPTEKAAPKPAEKKPTQPTIKPPDKAPPAATGVNPATKSQPPGPAAMPPGRADDQATARPPGIPGPMTLPPPPRPLPPAQKRNDQQE